MEPIAVRAHGRRARTFAKLLAEKRPGPAAIAGARFADTARAERKKIRALLPENTSVSSAPRFAAGNPAEVSLECARISAAVTGRQIGAGRRKGQEKKEEKGKITKKRKRKRDVQFSGAQLHSRRVRTAFRRCENYRERERKRERSQDSRSSDMDESSARD